MLRLVARISFFFLSFFSGGQRYLRVPVVLFFWVCVCGCKGKPKRTPTLGLPISQRVPWCLLRMTAFEPPNAILRKYQGIFGFGDNPLQLAGGLRCPLLPPSSAGQQGDRGRLVGKDGHVAVVKTVLGVDFGITYFSGDWDVELLLFFPCVLGTASLLTQPAKKKMPVFHMATGHLITT